MTVSVRKKASWVSKRGGKVFHVKARKPFWNVNRKVLNSNKVIDVRRVASDKWLVTKYGYGSRVKNSLMVDTPAEAGKLATRWQSHEAEKGFKYKIRIPKLVATKLKKVIK